MDDVKWIKLYVNIFDNRKIKMLRTMPDGDSLALLWLSLLCLAGSTNDDGMIYMTREFPYTEQTLSTQLGFPITLIQMALPLYVKLGMIEIVDDILCVSNWERYQNVDRLTELREYNRIAKQKSRAKQKALLSMTCQSSQGIEEDKEIDKEEEKEIKDKGRDPFLSLKNSEPEIYQALRDFEEMRRKIKKPMTNRSKSLLLKKLAEYPDSDWIQMLETSIDHCWQTIYPLKGGNARGCESTSFASDGEAGSKFAIRYDA